MSKSIETLPEAEAIAARLESDATLGTEQTAHALFAKIPNARNVVLATVFRALGAKRRVFEKGNSEPRLEPDHRTQVDAAKLLLAYGDGLPPQTNIVNVEVAKESQTKDSDFNFDEALENSPAMREMFRKRIDDAEARAAKRPRLM